MKQSDLEIIRKADMNLRKALVARQSEKLTMPSSLNAKLMERIQTKKRSSRFSYRRIWLWLDAACIICILVGLWNLKDFIEEPAKEQIVISEKEADTMDCAGHVETVKHEETCEVPAVRTLTTKGRDAVRQYAQAEIDRNAGSSFTEPSISFSLQESPSISAGFGSHRREMIMGPSIQESMIVTDNDLIGRVPGYGSSLKPDFRLESKVMDDDTYADKELDIDMNALPGEYASKALLLQELLNVYTRQIDSLNHEYEFASKGSVRQRIKKQIKESKTMRNKIKLSLTILCLSALSSADAQNDYSDFTKQYHEKWGAVLSFPEESVTYEIPAENDLYANRMFMFADIIKAGNCATFPIGAIVKLDNNCTILLEEHAIHGKPSPSHHHPLDEHSTDNYTPSFVSEMLNNLYLPWFHIDHDRGVLDNDTLMAKINEAKNKYVLAIHKGDKLTKRTNSDFVGVVKIPDMTEIRTMGANQSLNLLKSLYSACYGVSVFRADRFKSIDILVFMNQDKKTIHDYVEVISRYVKFEDEFKEEE